MTYLLRLLSIQPHPLCLRFGGPQRRSQEFDLGGYKLHDIEFVLGQRDKTTI